MCNGNWNIIYDKLNLKINLLSEEAWEKVAHAIWLYYKTAKALVIWKWVWREAWPEKRHNQPLGNEGNVLYLEDVVILLTPKLTELFTLNTYSLFHTNPSSIMYFFKKNNEHIFFRSNNLDFWAMIHKYLFLKKGLIFTWKIERYSRK